uniref:Uncharacterized protein n=1 Tax=Parascaris equorum TaxID=6256 RepID=A0A914RY13_PAREQ
MKHRDEKHYEQLVFKQHLHEDFLFNEGSHSEKYLIAISKKLHSLIEELISIPIGWFPFSFFFDTHFLHYFLLE